MEKSRVVTSVWIRVRHSNEAKQPLVDSIDNIRWLLGYVTKILRGSFAPVLVHSRSPLCFARMRLAPMRVPQIVLQNARFSSFATSRPNWINPELKGISKRACYVNRKHIRNEAGQQNFGKIRIPYLLRFYCPLWTRITTCVAYASQSIGKAKRIVDTCVWQRRNRRGFWSLKGEEGGSVEREDK